MPRILRQRSLRGQRKIAEKTVGTSQGCLVRCESDVQCPCYERKAAHRCAQKSNCRMQAARMSYRSLLSATQAPAGPGRLHEACAALCSLLSAGPCAAAAAAARASGSTVGDCCGRFLRRGEGCRTAHPGTGHPPGAGGLQCGGWRVCGAEAAAAAPSHSAAAPSVPSTTSTSCQQLTGAGKLPGPHAAPSPAAFHTLPLPQQPSTHTRRSICPSQQQYTCAFISICPAQQPANIH